MKGGRWHGCSESPFCPHLCCLCLSQLTSGIRHSLTKEYSIEKDPKTPSPDLGEVWSVFPGEGQVWAAMLRTLCPRKREPYRLPTINALLCGDSSANSEHKSGSHRAILLNGLLLAVEVFLC